LFEAQAADLSDYAAFRRIGSILANDLGQMRVRFQPRQYAVPAAYRDDNSFLWDHGESKGSPAESHELIVPNPSKRPASREDAAPDDARANAPSSEVELGRAAYPEWDHRLSLARADWCTVIEKRPTWQVRLTPGRAVSVPDALPLIPLASSRQLSRRRRRRRQWEGDDIDLNAAIEVMVDQRLDLSPDPRLFMRPGGEERATSILVLLDLSESTHDCVPGTMQSIVDIEKEAALLLARSVLRGNDRIAVHGFSSNTRAEVNYYRLLDFGGALDATAIGRIRGMSARHSTRMGAALRHATACLAGESGHRRSIVVVTDGAPSDVDVFEPGYLIADARAAVSEARQKGVQTYGIVLDPLADGYARTMFGWGRFQIVDDPRLLSRQLSRLHARLM
jgi:nitric oxide reductase activation protein